MTAITQRELAVRLGLPPSSLISRPKAAALLGRESRSLANQTTGNSLPGFYNLSGMGVKGGVILYRRDWIDAFLRWSAMDKAEREKPSARKSLECLICFGPQELPEPATISIPLKISNIAGLSHAETLMLSELVEKSPNIEFELGAELILISDQEIPVNDPEFRLILNCMRQRIVESST